MTGQPEQSADTMSAVCLVSPRGVDGLHLEQLAIPRPESGEALVEVHAASITRDELEVARRSAPRHPLLRAVGSDRYHPV
jgi:NADPH:quinone reductase-like Zn-dependent oxidoreductase